MHILLYCIALHIYVCICLLYICHCNLPLLIANVGFLVYICCFFFVLFTLSALIAASWVLQKTLSLCTLQWFSPRLLSTRLFYSIFNWLLFMLLFCLPLSLNTHSFHTDLFGVAFTSLSIFSIFFNFYIFKLYFHFKLSAVLSIKPTTTNSKYCWLEVAQKTKNGEQQTNGIYEILSKCEHAKQ